MNNKNNKKIKNTFSSLINNNRFLLVFSFIAAFALWMWVAIEQSPEVQKVISKVPVTIKYENSVPEKLGLQIFGKSDFTVDITVTGKKYIVSSLTADDFNVVANTNNADSSGKKALKLLVTPKEENSDFSITSYSESEVEVFFDRYKEVEMPIVVNINSTLTKFVPDNHKLGETVPSVDRVLISGPSTIVNQIDTLNANIDVNEMLTQTTTKQANIVLLSKEGTTVDASLVDFSESNITVTLPVMKIVNLPTAVEFKNAPTYFTNNPIAYTVYPSTVQVAIPVDLVDTTNHYVVDVIDFAQINNKKNVYKVSAEDSKSFEFLDADVSYFTVTIDASGMTAKTFTVPEANITVKNSNNSYDVKALNNSGKTITVIGTADAISALTDNDFQIIVDTSEQDFSVNTKSLKGRVVVPNNKQCWSVGDCNINVSVKEK